MKRAKEELEYQMKTVITFMNINPIWPGKGTVIAPSHTGSMQFTEEISVLQPIYKLYMNDL